MNNCKETIYYIWVNYLPSVKSEQGNKWLRRKPKRQQNLVQSAPKGVILFSFFSMTRGEKRCGAHNRKKKLSKKKKALTEMFYVWKASHWKGSKKLFASKNWQHARSEFLALELILKKKKQQQRRARSHSFLNRCLRILAIVRCRVQLNKERTSWANYRLLLWSIH